MARPESKNPLEVIVSFRIDRPTEAALHKVIDAERPHHLGQRFRLQEAARLLMYEGLRARGLLAEIEQRQRELEALPSVPAKGRKKRPPKKAPPKRE